MDFPQLKFTIKSSPQFLIYQKAVREYFGDEIQINETQQIINQWEMAVK